MVNEAVGMVVLGLVTVSTVTGNVAPAAIDMALIVSCMLVALLTVHAELIVLEQPVDEASEMAVGAVMYTSEPEIRELTMLKVRVKVDLTPIDGSEREAEAEAAGMVEVVEVT